MLLSQEMPGIKHMITHGLYKLLCDGDELSGLLRQYRIEPAIIILLTCIKQLV